MTSELKNEERSQPKESIGVVSLHLSTTREYFTYHRQLTNHILFIIWFYYHSRFLVSILEHTISLSYGKQGTESGFQTAASRRRNASESPSLPPASQSTISPTSYKNRTPLTVKGIDTKYNTQLRTMSELRQYHPSLKVSNSISLKMAGFSKVSLPKISPSCSAKSYHSADATKGKILVFKGVSTHVTIDDFKELLEYYKITHAEAERMTSKRSGRDLPFIKIKRDIPKQAEALISGGGGGGDLYARKQA